MVVVAIIGIGVVLLLAVVLLFGPKPRNGAEGASEQDQTERAIVDYTPPSSGGGP